MRTPGSTSATGPGTLTPTGRRTTPTAKQTAMLLALGDDALAKRAVEALHALNRRAKEIRDRRNTYRRATFAKPLTDEMEAIYSLKDAFLEALVLANRASVSTFEIDRSLDNKPCERECDGCGRSWFGEDWCHECQDASGVATRETWFVIDCGGGYRFHQPHVSDRVAARACPIPAHNPTQPQREIPKIGLTIEAQRRCIKMAIERLHLGVVAWTPDVGKAP